MSNQGKADKELFKVCPFKRIFNKYTFREGYNANCLKVSITCLSISHGCFFFFSSPFHEMWQLSSLFSTRSKLLGPFFLFYLHFTRVCALPVWSEYVWHLGMAQCEQTGHHWDGAVGCLFNACLLWKSPWNRRSKYPHWSRGRGPYDDVVAKSHGSKSNRQ